MARPNQESAAPERPSPPGADPVLDRTLTTIFRAITETVVPEARALPDEGWLRLIEIVNRALAQRPPALRRQIRIFLRLVQWLPLARWFRRFTALDLPRRTRWLASLQDAPVLLIRRGFWGVRTLAFMGYYGLPEVRRSVGYRAHPRGWKAERVRRGEADPETLDPPVDVQM